ncbi:MAG TPA: hypothetical protein VG759_13570 [Candidatus Angelobacter sp.]|nr:hypothetical protein [Candidatus Angelobacter sp.]
MASTATSQEVETATIRAMLSEIQEIESAFLLRRANKFSITITVPAKDYDVEDRICDVQLRLMDRFTNYSFDFNIVPLNGRKATDVVTPSGQLILNRAA